MTDEQVEKIIKSNMMLQMNLAGIRADFEEALQRTWVGLTDKEYLEAESVVWITINLDSDEKEANRDFYQTIEAKLKEKNT